MLGPTLGMQKKIRVPPLGLETGNIKESTSNSPADGCMQ